MAKNLDEMVKTLPPNFIPTVAFVSQGIKKSPVASVVLPGMAAWIFFASSKGAMIKVVPVIKKFSFPCWISGRDVTLDHTHIPVSKIASLLAVMTSTPFTETEVRSPCQKPFLAVLGNVVNWPLNLLLSIPPNVISPNSPGLTLVSKLRGEKQDTPTIIVLIFD